MNNHYFDQDKGECVKCEQFQLPTEVIIVIVLLILLILVSAYVYLVRLHPEILGNVSNLKLGTLMHR